MTLATTQRAMLTLITADEPHGAGELVCGPDASTRVGLYRRSYRMRALECLRASYPGLRHALTPPLFDEFALEYLAAEPPHSYTLAALGGGWPGYLDATRPEREPWTDFIVDLARLERAFAEAYDAPGPEGAPPLVLADEPDPSLTVEPVGCLRLLHASSAVGDYLLAVRAGGDPVMPARGDSYIVLSRRNYVVTLTTLDRASWGALEALTRGAPVGDRWQQVREWAALGFFR
jgi:hypothetical protein